VSVVGYQLKSRFFWLCIITPTALAAVAVATLFNGNRTAGTQSVEVALTDYDRMRSIANYQQTLKNSEQGGAEQPFEELFLKPGTPALITAELLSKIRMPSTRAWRS
jgi:hypothetical protein